MEYSFYGFIGLLGKFFFTYAIGFRQSFKYFYHEGALVALASEWDGSHVRAVGFQHDAVHRHHGREIFSQMTALESGYTADAQHEVIEREEF